MDVKGKGLLRGLEVSPYKPSVSILPPSNLWPSAITETQ